MSLISTFWIYARAVSEKYKSITNLPDVGLFSNIEWKSLTEEERLNAKKFIYELQGQLASNPIAIMPTRRVKTP